MLATKLLCQNLATFKLPQTHVETYFVASNFDYFLGTVWQISEKVFHIEVEKFSEVLVVILRFLRSGGTFIVLWLLLKCYFLTEIY